MSKVCSKCGIFKELARFHKNAACADGHVGVCKSCKNENEVSLKYRKSFDINKLLKHWAIAT